MGLLAAALGGTPIRAQDAPTQQRNAVAAMQESLAKQRASVQKQVEQTRTDGFFILPRPEGLGSPPVSGAQASCDPLPPAEVDSLIGQAAMHQGVDQDLLRTVMKMESGFHPCAVSEKGAMGLMQLMPATAEQLGVQDPFNPSQNVDAGARFLKDLLTRYGGDLFRALGAYNAGPSRVDAAGGVPAFPETLNYIQQILSSLPIKP